MTIRQGTDEDIPSIVELLKLSLGESLMPKSEVFWKWKHVDNPFGKSPVLLAFEGEQLIGVRAFLRWEWKHGNKIYKAVRAVDTATHPNYQGKGIFKKLTLQLVEQCKNEGVDFIFNTPNTSSKPGYLKMGWVSNGKMKVSVQPRISWGKTNDDFDSKYAIRKDQRISMNVLSTQSDRMQTAVSEKFLHWRYTQNPNVVYNAFSDSDIDPTYLTVFRLKPYRFGVEFRICDEFQSSEVNKKAYQQRLKQIVNASGANLLTSANPQKVFSSVSLSVGPEITTHPLSFDYNFLSFNFWKPSLGDMEVF